VNPKTYPRFEKEFDISITEDNYASNEDALAKLQAGAKGYDIVVPTGYMVEIMWKEGLLFELDARSLYPQGHFSGRKYIVIHSCRMIMAHLLPDVTWRGGATRNKGRQQ
jgi:hypothetical protein